MLSLYSIINIFLLFSTAIAAPIGPLQHRNAAPQAICNTGEYSVGDGHAAKSWITVRNIETLNKKRSCIISPRSIKRMACEKDTAVWIGNRMDFELKLDCNDIAADAQAILNTCCGTHHASCQNNGQGRMFGPGSIGHGEQIFYDTIVVGDRC